jgi:hypothetical protein
MEGFSTREQAQESMERLRRFVERIDVAILSGDS